MILFDWGTYNGLTKLPTASTLGMKLTEIPPYDLSRRKPEDYFENYGKVAREAFTTITAHAPYYNVVSTSRAVQETTTRAFLVALQRAKLAGAQIFNLHLGWRAYMDHRDLEEAGQVLRRLAEEAGSDTVISVEVPYTSRMLGLWDEIRELRQMVGEDRLIVSVQLENAWLLETGASETGDFEGANSRATVDFWKDLLRRAMELSSGYLSLRFSQVIGFAIGRRILKKRVPLGKGYPDLEPLAQALAEFMVKEVREKQVPLRMHLIYTGPPETKYRDTITLYAEVMKQAVKHL